MAVREYIGARYVPVFADPIQWDPTSVYEPLTVVTDQGASYVSRRMVPEGIQLSNTDYWVLWADFNAQLQHYIDEVETFDGRIDAIEDALPIADYTSQATVSDAIDAVKDVLPFEDFSSASTVSDAIDAIGARFPVVTADIADNAVTIDKVASSVFSMQKNLVLIGDSWTNANVYPQKLVNEYGYTVHKYAMGGAGFIRAAASTGKTIADYAADAIADTSYDHGKIGAIVIQGGVNDYRDDTTINSGRMTNLANAIKNIVNALKQSFTNAKIYVLIGQLSWYQSAFTDTASVAANSNYAQMCLWNSVRKKLAQMGITAYCTYGWVDHSLYQADDLHLEDDGYYVFAANVHAILTGVEPIYKQTTIAARDTHTVGVCEMIIDQDTINVAYQMFIRTTSTSNYLTSVDSGAFANFIVTGSADNTEMVCFSTRDTDAVPCKAGIKSNGLICFISGTPSAGAADKTYKCGASYPIRSYF